MHRLLPAILLLFTLSACSVAPAPTQPPSPTARPTATLAPIPTLAPSPTITPSATPEPSPTPFGCQMPPDDYTLISLGQHVLNQRTLAMLTHAQTLYGGSHDFVRAITQGSYTPGLAASFGTHDGGGALDLSVRNLNDYFDLLTEELPAIIDALRRAGFAAWVREEDELYAGSPIHIHAIAIGDRDLSPAAREQLTGPAAYFRGYDGLPLDPPRPDRYGGPILCPWMETLGYTLLEG